jgi:uncharacterized RDD family membrane protein YckC
MVVRMIEPATYGTDGTETPSVEYAGWGRRVVARLADTLVIVVIGGAVVLILYAILGEDAGIGAYIAVALAGPPLYETVFHGRESGQTPGKRLLGIRIRGEDGGRLSYGRAFGRWVVAYLLSLLAIPLLISYLRPLWNAKNQTWQDSAVSSVVVRE